MMVFEEWILKNEGMFDLFKVKSIPNSPSEIYTHPEVNRYYREILNVMGIRPGELEELDDKGGVKGRLNKVPVSVEQAMKRFIAAHIIGGGEKKSFLQVSFHDAVTIIDFLHSVRRQGSSHNLARELHVDEPQSLATWFSNKLPTAHDAIMAADYGKASRDYEMQKGKGLDFSKYPVHKDLADSIYSLLINFYRRDGLPLRRFFGIHGQINDLIAKAKKAYPQNQHIQALRPFDPLTQVGQPIITSTDD